MAGPIGHGISKALRDAREKGAYANRGRRSGPPWWAWLIAAVVLVAAMVWASVTLK
jgi:hypothetical protein